MRSRVGPENGVFSGLRSVQWTKLLWPKVNGTMPGVAAQQGRAVRSSSTFAVCALALASCELAAAQVTVRVDTLDAELLSQAPAIGWPGFIQPWGEHLIVSDWQGDPNLHALDRSSGELIVSFGRIGRGPGDFPGLLAGVQRPAHDSSAIWVFDGRKLTRVASLGSIGTDAPTIDLTGVPLVVAAEWLDSTTILGVTLRPPEGRFVVFDNLGRVIEKVPGVLLGHEGVPVAERVVASGSFSLCVHPQGKAFALLYKEAATIQVYDRSANHVVDAAVPHMVDAPFDRVDGEIRFVPTTMTYSSCWGSAKLLYALYSGDDFETASPGTLGGQELHAFDWDTGRLVKILHLDVRIFGFAVDEESGWLYGGSLEDASVYRFRYSSKEQDG